VRLPSQDAGKSDADDEHIRVEKAVDPVRWDEDEGYVEDEIEQEAYEA
jgi:hypothetical protein